MSYLRKSLFILGISSAAALSYSHFSTSSRFFRSRNDPGLVGWWVGASEEGKVPNGQLIHISAEKERYLARSYSPWQLATAKNGTPVFEVSVTTGLEGECKGQATYLKASCQDSLGSSDGMNLDMRMFYLTAPNKISQDQWAETLMRVAASNGEDTDKETLKNLLAKYGMNQGVERDKATKVAVDSVKEKPVIYIVYDVGDIQKFTGALSRKLHRVPATLERKGCFSFCLTLETDTDQYKSGDHSHEVYRTMDHVILDMVDCVGRGISIKKEEDLSKFYQLVLSQAQNQQPLLSQLTTFNRIDVPTSFDPLNGLYTGSNGYLAREVIQIRRLFGPWKGDGGINDVSEHESCDYVEAVNLTGDSDIPAGQVVFRAKVGEKYKLSPGIVLEAKFEAVARYKGKGRLTGFQNSEWVDVDVLILGEKYRRDGFAIGVLYSASDYFFLKLFKELNLQSFQ